MLVIRNAQRAALIAPQLKALHAWLHPHLRKHFEDELAGLDDAALQALIEAAVARAVERGANRTKTIGHYVYLRVLFGEHFEALPWAAETLARTDFRDPDERIEGLYARGRYALASEEGAR